MSHLFDLTDTSTTSTPTTRTRASYRRITPGDVAIATLRADLALLARKGR